MQGLKIEKFWSKYTFFPEKYHVKIDKTITAINEVVIFVMYLVGSFSIVGVQITAIGERYIYSVKNKNISKPVDEDVNIVNVELFILPQFKYAFT